MIKELQEEHDLLLAESKLIKSKMDTFNKKVQDNGFYIKKNKIVSDEQLFGCFYETTYYSHFDGHTSDAIYDEYSGVIPISNECFEHIKNIIDNFNTLTASEIIKSLELAFEDDDFELPGSFDNEICILRNHGSKKIKNKIEHFSFEIKPDYLKIEIEKEEAEQGELEPGSYMEFRKTTQSEISKTKTTQEERRG